MKLPLVLAIDGGNTKTIAVVATTTGEVLGTALSGCSDIYGAASEQEALAVLVGAVREALAEAGASPSDIATTVGSLAGADWPEDHDLYCSELSHRAGLPGPVHVFNDGVGPVRLANHSGTGVAVVVGTGAAVGARGPAGDVWHGSFWLPVGAAGWLGRQALAAVYRAALGIGPPTSLTATLLALFAADDEEAMLHAFSRRPASRLSGAWERAAGTSVLDADARGDPVAREIIGTYAAQLAPYVMVAARRVGLGPSFDVVLTGGLVRHTTSSLPMCLAREVLALVPGAKVTRSTAAPVAGAVLEAIALSGTEITDALVSTVAGSGLLAGLGSTQAGSPGTQATGPSVDITASPSQAAHGRPLPRKLTHPNAPRR